MPLRALWLAGGLLVLAAATWVCATAVFQNDARVNSARAASASAKEPSVPAESPALATRAKFPTLPHSESENAADLLKDAYVLFNALTAEEKEMLKHPDADLNNAAAAALFQKIQPILDLMRQASDAPYCDWAMGPWNFHTRIPQVLLALKLAQLARWSAQYRFDEEPENAVADLAAGMQTGRRVGDAAMIGFLVDAAAQRIAWDGIARNTDALTPKAIEQVNGLLRTPALLDDLPRAMETERSGLRNVIEMLLDPKTREAAMADFVAANAVWAAEMPMPATWQSAVADLRWQEQMESEFIQKAPLSEREFSAWRASMSDGAKADSFSESTLSSAVGLRTKALGDQISRAMLSAGLNVMTNGPAALDAVRDPVTREPFIYAPLPNGGFELRSKFDTGNKRPLALTFPAPAQK